MYKGFVNNEVNNEFSFNKLNGDSTFLLSFSCFASPLFVILSDSEESGAGGTFSDKVKAKEFQTPKLSYTFFSGSIQFIALAKYHTLALRLYPLSLPSVLANRN